jgi:membrane associated rhomboid family serine protease
MLRGNPTGGWPGSGGGQGGVRYQFGPGVSLPRAIKTLILLNVGIFFLTKLAGWNESSLRSTFGLVPADVIGQGYVWQLVTYLFLHAGLFHLLINMLMLWMFGTAVAHAWGSRAFLPYYFVCGVGGAVITLLTSHASVHPTIGASGAVLGVVLAYGLMYPDRQVLLFFLIPIKMKYFIGMLVLVDLWGSAQDNGIANFAHLGGMLFGFLYLKQDWRLTGLGRKLRAKRARLQMQRNTRRAEKRQPEPTVDDILDKINEHGMPSLTEEERRILHERRRR